MIPRQIHYVFDKEHHADLGIGCMSRTQISKQVYETLIPLSESIFGEWDRKMGTNKIAFPLDIVYYDKVAYLYKHDDFYYIVTILFNEVIMEDEVITKDLE
jgi:hypothetical protein